MLRQSISLFLFFLSTFFCVSTPLYADTTPKKMTFELVLATQQGGVLKTKKDVILRIGEKDPDTNIFTSNFEQSYSKVQFQEGFASFIIGTDSELEAAVFDGENVVIQVEVDSTTVEIPIPSVPYAIQASTAEYVDTILASNIQGAFTQDLVVNEDLHVYGDDGTALYVDSDEKQVGVGTDSPAYNLDVSGSINADDYLVNGEDIESVFSWKKTGTSMYYTDGNVGIGTSNPEVALDVVGTVNATEFYRKHQTLNEYLQAISNWKDSNDDGDIYFTGGNVGLGVTEGMDERLVVSGAIKINSSPLTNPEAGTIEYDPILDDFFAYSDSTKYSLSGVQASGNVADTYIAYWSGTKHVTGTSNLVFSDGMLGIGTSNPTAFLTIQGDGVRDYFSVYDEDGDSTFRVNSSGNITVGDITSNYALSVDGIIDASQFYLNGVPLLSSLSSGSFWAVGNPDESGVDLFYDRGNVGIGTQDPDSLLELASEDKDVGITFDIEGEDLFTIGIPHELKNVFLISEGGDLSKPIFTFTRSALGFGTNSPNASLHVSGNQGLLIEGAFDEDYVIQDLSTTTDNPTISSFFYLPARSIFRAGRSNGHHWATENMGDYSVGFGYNTIASGEFSVVAGGYDHIATGNYATVAGGYQNKAVGDYSFAAGRFAEALHDGTFVWSDATVSTNAFQSTQKNQFLVRAFGGVGINTNDTEGSAFVVEYDDEEGNVLELRGFEDTALVVDAEGAVGIGTTELGSAALSVEGKVGIGTTEPEALFQVMGNEQDDYLFYASSPQLTDPDAKETHFVINSSGNVGIGTLTPASELDVNGKIYATSFVLVDPDNPNGYVTLQPFSGSPWADPSSSSSGVDTYRVEGFVGIGTSEPDTLLELSNQNTNKDLPIITFDLNDTSQYQIGVATTNQGSFFMISSSQNYSTTNTLMALSDSSLVLGRGAVTSDATLDVSGNTIIQGKLAVGTSNLDFVYDAYVNGALQVTSLNIAGEDFKLADDPPWTTNGLNIYTESNVGIQVTDPSVELEVNGTISANSVEFTDEFTLDGSLYTDRMYFEDQVSDNVYGSLYVDDGILYYQYDSDPIVEISSPLKYSPTSNSGPLAYWVNDSSIGVAPIMWDEEAKILSLTSNLVVSNYYSTDEGLRISSNLEFRDDTALSVEAQLDHYGLVTVVTDYTVQDIDLEIKQDWGKYGEPVSVRGLNMDFDSEGTIVNNSSVIGLYVDVEDVNIDEDQDASKYAAVFLGGNVGIGVTNPSVELEVNGVISANYFNLSQGLTVEELTVDETNNTFIAQTTGLGEPRVGIGTSEPSVELEVLGTISANRVLVNNGLTASTVNIGSSSFVVDASGNIGIGTSSPSASFQVVDVFSEQLDAPHISERVDVTVKGDASDGYVFYFSQDITGMQLNIDTEDDTFVKDNVITGMDIDFTTFNIQDSSTAYGLFVDVSKPDEDVEDNSTRYAAVFNGGYVGIGVTEPEAELHVSGNIIADSLILEGGLEIQTLTVNNLVVNESASINAVTVNELVVLDSITARTLIIEEGLTVKDVEFDTISANNGIFALLTTTTLNVTANFEATEGVFTKGLAVGTDNIPASGIYVSGNVLASTIDADFGVTAATLNVGEGALFVSSDSFVGIGTEDPVSMLHINSLSTALFDAEDTTTWAAFRLSLDDEANAAAAAGIAFVPADNATTNVGSGIVAARVSNTASDLVFITDPRTDDPQERMRIDSKGNVGIGVTEPEALFHVNGDTLIDGSVTVNDTLHVSVISSNGELTISAENGVTFEDTVDFESGISINNALLFSTMSYADLPDIDKPQLYVSDEDNDLYLKRPDGVSINITKAFTGISKKVPYYGESGALEDDAALAWDYETNQFKIGTANAFAQFAIDATFDDNQTSASVQQIDVNFANRSSASEALSFVGLGISMDSSPTLQDYEDGLATDFGRLADGETAIGLDVDMRELVHLDSFGSIRGNKYAALLQGGYVGIGTASPEAWLHVQNEWENNYEVENLFRVEGNSGLALVVTSENNGFVGLGEESPEARLHVSSLGANETIVLVSANAASGKAFQIVQDGLVIGSKDDVLSTGVLLDVNGIIEADEAYLGKVSTNELVVGEYLKITTAGMAVGTTNLDNSDADLFVYRKVADGSETIIGEKVEVVIDGDTIDTDSVTQPFIYKADITGVGLTFESGDDNDQLSGVLTGVSVNVSGVSVNGGSVYGLYINPGAGDNRYAAVFEGGNVGVGVENPAYELDVTGTIKAESLILDGSGFLEVSDLVADTVDVADEMYAATVNVRQDLIADHVSANRLRITGQIEFATLNVESITINEGLYVGGLVDIGLGDDFPDGYVLGVSGNTYVSGNLFADRISVDVISANAGSTVNVNSDFIVNGIISANNFKTDVFQITQGDGEVSGIDGIGQLFVTGNGHLMYLRPNTTDPAVDLMWKYSGKANHVPHFDSEGALSTDAAMQWNDDLSQLTLGSVTQNVTLSVVATVNADTSTDISAQSINLIIEGDRSGGASQQLTALNIDMTSGDDGRLGDEETAIGLRVDMRDLIRLEDDSEGNKYAALFQGGYVGIGTDTPEAWLHVQDQDSNNYYASSLFRVEGNSGLAMVVSSNGHVGLGEESPEARLHVSSLDSNETIMMVSSNAASGKVLHVLEDGVLLGAKSDSLSSGALLDVRGIVEAEEAVFGLVTTNELIIGSYLHITTENMSVGTTNVNALDSDLYVYKKIETGDADFIGEKVDIVIDGDSSSNAYNDGYFVYKGDITGLGFTFDTGDANDRFSGTMTGVSVNLESVSVNGGTLYGLHINPGDGDNRYAAVFEGGNVGIGVESPEYELDVSGSIRAKGLVLAEDSFLDLGYVSAVTANISGDVYASTVRVVDLLEANTVSANNISIGGLISFVTINVETITVNEGLHIAEDGILNIGLGSNFPSGYVMGVSGNAFVSGNLYTETLFVDILTANTGSEIVVSADMHVSGSVSSNTMTADTITLAPYSGTITAQDYGQLFVSSNGDLMFQESNNSDGALVNLMAIYTGEANRIPVFNSSGTFSTDGPLFWDDTKKEFSIGSTTDKASFVINGTVTANQSTSYSSHSLNLSFGNNYDEDENLEDVMKGLEIIFESKDKDTEDFGRLNANDKAIGVHVDFSNLEALYNDGAGLVTQTYPKAAVFQGGLVGVGTTDPSASLHIVKSPREEDEDLDIFKVDLSENAADQNRFVVDSQGRLGMNATDLSAQLTIKELDEPDQDIFAVYNDSSNPIFVVSSNGVAINSAIPTAALSVDGDFIVGDFGTSVSDVFSVTNQRMGIGTSNPTAKFEIVKGSGSEDLLSVISASNEMLTVDSTGKVSMGTTKSDYDVNVGGVVLSTDVSANNLAQSDDYVMYSGFISVKNDDFVYLGQVSENASVKSSLLFSDDSFVFRHVSYNTNADSTFTDVLFLGKDGVGVNSLSDGDSVFYVDGDMKVEIPSAVDLDGTDAFIGTSVFKVTDSGNVGVRTDTPTANLDVYGSLSAKSIDITDSGISITTLNISDSLSLEADVANGAVTYNAQLISINLRSNIENNLYGLKVNMVSDLTDGATTPPDDDDYFHISEEADAYGLFVDMSGLIANTRYNSPLETPDNHGYKYAAAFLGGNVGIGTTQPEAPLEVRTNDLEPIVGFGTDQSELVFEDIGEGVMAINLVYGGNALTNSALGLVFAKGEATGGVIPNARIGVGTTNPDKALVVNGDIRVGVVSGEEDPITISKSEGNKLIFSGGATTTGDTNSDNGDNLFMQRVNHSQGVSELRVNFSEFEESANDPDYDSVENKGTGDDKFVIGHTTSAFEPIFSVYNNDTVGIAVNGEDFQPEAPLHVKGSPSGEDYVAMFTNSSTSLAEESISVLGLAFTDTALNIAKANSDFNFINFRVNDSVLGQIEANKVGGTELVGVRFLTRGADYAEYLEKSDHSEDMEVGDIVGVVDGKISKDTRHAQQLMVLSDTAGVAGNWQGDDDEHYELVAFFGQIKTKVKGKVNKGDFIVASGEHDGIGRAVSARKLSFEDRKHIVGRAWEESSDKDVKFINTAVGFEFGAHSLKDEMDAIEDLEDKLEDLEDEKDKLLEEYDELFDAQSREIDRLLSTLEANN